MLASFIYTVDGIDYQVNIVRKRMKNVHYRFRDGQFLVSCNRLVTKQFIVSGLDKFARELIKRSAKTKKDVDGMIYIFGVAYEQKYPINIETVSIIESNKDKVLKQLFLNYIKESVARYSTLMGVGGNYKVRVSNAKTRFGSNSRGTKTLSFSIMLLKFSKEIIDSVVVHELAHCKYYDHSANFYSVVYQYCPNYNVLRKKLINSEFN